MKIFRKITKTIIIGLVIIELALLGIETKSYVTNKYSNITINGRIVAGIDNIVNFSGMAR